MEFILKNWKELLITLLTAVCLVLIMSTSCVNHRNDVLSNNINALRDSVEYIQLQNGNMVAEKQSLILDRDQLSEYLEISKKEVKDLQKKLDSKIAQIAELKGSVRIDTIMCTDSIYIKDSAQYIDFKFKDDWIDMCGTTNLQLKSTQINNLTISTPLTLGLTEDNKYFVTSPNPYLQITDINSAIVDSKKSTKPKRWNVGIQLGIGVQYDLLGRRFGVGPYFGVGGSYGFSF